VAAEVDDVGSPAHQNPREVVESDGPVRVQLQAVAVFRAVDLGIDGADLVVEGELGGARGIGGEEQDFDHEMSSTERPGAANLRDSIVRVGMPRGNLSVG
jgi:hypothetical protein